MSIGDLGPRPEGKQLASTETGKAAILFKAAIRRPGTAGLKNCLPST